jgi:dihydroorotate dehydrogenase (fumarate)
MDMTTEYMGLKLRNPLIVASCGLVSSVDGVKRCADAGAGAVVLKSLFEEQIEAETKAIQHELRETWHPEAFEYVARMEKALGPTSYLTLVQEAKKTASIPVIASLNCVTPKWWLDYAVRLADAGADAIELNMAIMPSDTTVRSDEIEQRYLDIVEGIAKRIQIPIAVKLGPYFTSLARFASVLCDKGTSALVLFNRFYQFDIDLNRIALRSANRLSSPREVTGSLRWISILSGRVGCDLAGATGIHDGACALKHILAGAAAFQICSTLYVDGLQKIETILSEMEIWMNNKGFTSIEQIRGRLKQSESRHPQAYERLQYIKALVGIE